MASLETTTGGRDDVTQTPMSDRLERSMDTPASGRQSSGDIDHDDTFDLQLSQITEDPNQVNIHQFYPELEHQFMKRHSVSDKMKEDEDVTDTGMALVLRDRLSVSTNNTQWTKEDENNSSDPQKSQNTAASDNTLFSTAVDENTLQEAKDRQNQSIFQTEKWGLTKPKQPSMQEIMEASAELHFNKALKSKEEDDHVSVIFYANKSLGVKGEQVRCYVERAEAYIHLCDFQSAILNYKKVCLLEPASEQYYDRLAFLYFFQGQSLFDQRLYPEALEAFSRAAEMKPDNVGYHIRSITCLAALQRHGECLALVNKRLEIDTDNADLYVMRARLHEMFRNTTLCYYDVKDALGLNPDHSEARKMMDKLESVAQDNKRQAMHLNLLSKHRDALQKISIAIETDPAVADFHVLRGALHRKLGDFNAAIDDFLLALDKCDHDEESSVYVESQRQLLLTYNDFAVECFTKGFYEEAIILLNKAIKGEKREKGLYINRGDCFFRQEEFNFALQDYHQALELDPKDDTVKSRISVIHNEFGVSAYQEKLYPDAEKQFTEAIQYHPKVGQYYISRSRARYMQENITSARGDLLMGLLLDPDNEDVISILSRLFPGKSVGDVLNSRAAESAKYAIRQIFNKPVTKKDVIDEDEESVVSEPEGGDEGSQKADDDVQSEVTEATSMSQPVWHPEAAVSEFKFMMEEREFNVKLVEIKQEVNSKVKSALLERRSLKYTGARVQPLPPPNPKPTYGGHSIRKEKVIPAGKQRPYNWKQFNSLGIGLGGN